MNSMSTRPNQPPRTLVKLLRGDMAITHVAMTNIDARAGTRMLDRELKKGSAELMIFV